MKIEVKLFGNFQQYLPIKNDKYSCPLELEEGTNIGQVIEKLKIPNTHPMIILVNGIHRKVEEPLQEGDVLSIFPPVAGG
jgi:sulfur-carrier protein